MSRQRQTDPATEKILDNLSCAAPRFAVRGRTAPVGSLLKQVLREAVMLTPPGTRLPAIREIALRLGVSIMPVQRAIRELSEEKLLISRSKSGVFVGSDECREEERELPGGDAVCHIRFGTESVLGWQRSFWRRRMDAFREEHPGLVAEPVWLHGGGRTAPGRNCDVREITNSEPLPAWEEFRELPFGEIPVFERVSANVVHNAAVRVYHRTYFLFYNRDFLEAGGLEEPAYRSWEEQLAYIRLVGEAARRMNLEGRPFAGFHPSTLLGLRDLPESLELPAGRIDQLRTFYGLVQLMPSFNSKSPFDLLNDFPMGRCPLLLAGSMEHWRFRNEPPNFRWGVYPFFCASDTVFRQPVFMGIDRNSRNWIDALRFMEFLLGDVSQQEFARTGLIPVYAESLPEWNGGLPEPVFRDAPEYDFADPRTNYYVKNILEPELFRAAVGKQGWTEACANAVQLGRFYRRYASL